MSHNSPDAVEGSELSPRDEPYELPPLRSPQSIDGEPHEAAGVALDEFGAVLRALIGYSERLEALVRSTMLSEAITLPETMLPPSGAGGYPETTYELAATQKSQRALALAEDMVNRARRELDKPVAESRRLGVS